MPSLSQLRNAINECSNPEMAKVLSTMEKDMQKSSGALHDEQAQHADLLWQLGHWFGSLNLPQMVATAVLGHVGCEAVEMQLAFARAMAAEGSYDLLLGILRDCNLVEQLAKSIWDALLEMKSQSAVDSVEYEDKFSGFQLSYAGLKDFHNGLDELIGSPDPNLLEAMANEHCACADSKVNYTTGNYGITTTSEIEWAYVATPAKTPPGNLGIEAWPHEQEAKCAPDHFRDPIMMEELEERRAGVNERLKEHGVSLTLEEVMGVRLYTGPMFVKYNAVLRGLASGVPFMVSQYKELCQGNQYTTTLHVINSAIVKLGLLQPVCKVFCGMAGGKLPANFLKPDKMNVRGGVEAAFRSTSTDRNVALRYASSDTPGKAGLIIEIQQGMIDRGADLSWISMYPYEAEVCFSPLCGLEVMDMKVEGNVLVAAMRPNVNMKALTIEKVLAKRYQIITDMCKHEAADLLRASNDIVLEDSVEHIFGPGLRDQLSSFGNRVFQTHCKALEDREPTYYNNNVNFKQATAELINCVSFVRNLPHGLPSVAAATQPVKVRRMDGRCIGNDGGSGSKTDLDIHEPTEWPEGLLLLGHGYQAEDLVLASGTLVKQATRWTKVWSDAGSGKAYDYNAWLPACDDPDYVALGVFFTYRTSGVQEPRVPAGLVHKSCCETASLGKHGWTASGVGGRHSLELHQVMWGDQVMNLFMPMECSLMDDVPPAHRIVGGISASLLAAEEAWILNDSELGDAEVGLCAAALQLRPQVTTLNLSHNAFTLEALHALVQALEPNAEASLTELDLSHNDLGDEAGALLGKMLTSNRTLRSLNAAFCGLSRLGESQVVGALEHNEVLETLNLRGPPLAVAEVRKRGGVFGTVQVKYFSGVEVGSHAGLGRCKHPIHYYAPKELPDGMFLLGHGCRPDALVAASGPMVRRATHWKQVWTDAGSGLPLDSVVWLPACDDPDYVALGVFFAFGTKRQEVPQEVAGMVHKSACKPAKLGNFAWNDACTRARASLSLNMVRWDASSMNLMLPSVCTLMQPPPPPYMIHDGDAWHE